MGCLVDEAVLQCCHFLLDLPVVALEDPDMGNSNYRICLDDYLGADEAVRLPCSHIVGRNCLSKLIDPLGPSDNLCPYCRQVMYEQIEICPQCRENVSDAADESPTEVPPLVSNLVQTFAHDREKFEIIAGYATKAHSLAPLRCYMEYMADDRLKMPATEAELGHCFLHVLEKSIEPRTDQVETLRALWDEVNAEDQDIMSLERRLDETDQLYRIAREYLGATSLWISGLRIGSHSCYSVSPHLDFYGRSDSSIWIPAVNAGWWRCFWISHGLFLQLGRIGICVLERKDVWSKQDYHVNQSKVGACDLRTTESEASSNAVDIMMYYYVTIRTIIGVRSVQSIKIIITVRVPRVVAVVRIIDSPRWARFPGVFLKWVILQIILLNHLTGKLLLFLRLLNVGFLLSAAPWSRSAGYYGYFLCLHPTEQILRYAYVFFPWLFFFGGNGLSLLAALNTMESSVPQHLVLHGYYGFEALESNSLVPIIKSGT